MKTKIFLFVSVIILSLFSAHQLKSQTWTPQISGITTHLLGVSAPSSTVCYVSGSSGKILKTINGGTSWTQQTSGTTEDLYSILFTDLNNGYAVGNNGASVKTTNGGSTWTPMSIDASVNFRCVYFFDDTTGYATSGFNGGGIPGNIYKTSNGGLSWITESTSGISTNSIYSIYFTSSAVGYANDYNGNIIKTINGGTSWNLLSSAISNGLTGTMHFTSPSTGFVIGLNGAILKTTNSGTNWNTISSGSSDDLLGIDFYDANNGYIVGGDVNANIGSIFVTTNGGASWTPIALNAGTPRLTRIDMVDQNTGYAVGLNGTIMKRTKIKGLSIASPVNGANINNRCDLNFCIIDSTGKVGTNNPVTITNSNISGGETFQTDAYNVGTPGILRNFCLTNTSYSFTTGAQKFYLWYSSFGIVDSVTLNIMHPMHDLCSSISYSQTPLPNAVYRFSVTGLDSTQTYTLRLHSYNGAITDSVFVSGAVSGSLNHQYLHNGDYYPIFSVTSSCGDYCDDSTGNSINVTNGCAAYSLIAQGGFQNTTICLTDSATFSGVVNYSHLPANDTSSFIIKWGDGLTETHLIHTDTGGVDTLLRNHLYSSPGVYTALIKFYNDSACYNDSLIASINVNVCGNLKGNVFNDINNDCTPNSGESGMAGIIVKVTLGGNTYLAWTDTLGNYAFNALPTGSYTIQISNLNQGYTITCGNSLPHTINLTTGITVVNFAIYCNGFDVAVYGVALLNGFVPGQTDGILPLVGIVNSSCNSALPGQVKVVLSPCLTYTTICPWGNTHPTPTHIIHANTGDTLVWNVSDINNIGTFSYFDYFAHVITCTNAQVGDTACVTIMVLPTVGDADISNNTFTACFEIGVSFDPNEKEVKPKGIGSQGYIPVNTPDLTYTVNFQNTGTAKAYNIYVLDSINANLDISSIEILSSSHNVQPYLLPNRTMKFMFANIMLPDSTHDEEHSHGYVTYRIKSKTGISLGAQIKNTAYIYFDYNTPVVTNTTTNTIGITTGIREANNNGILKVYPNPANDKLIIRVNKNGNNDILIADVIGRKVKQIKTAELQTEVNVSDLQSGIYFITLTQDNVNYVQKIVIRK